MCGKLKSSNNNDIANVYQVNLKIPVSFLLMYTVVD